MKQLLAVILVLALLAFVYAEKGNNGKGQDDDSTGSSNSASEISEDDQDELEIEAECENEGDMHGRIKCRIREKLKVHANLGNDAARNFSMSNVCKELNGTQQVSCMARYRIINKCPFLPTLRATEVCVRNQLKISDNVTKQVRECENAGVNASECRAELSDNVDTLVLSRFESLKERAVRLQDKGADETLVVEFIANVDEKVAEYEAADTKEEKKQIVRDVAALWREFVKAAVAQIRANSASSGSGG